MKRFLALLLVFVFVFALIFSSYAYADPLSAYQLGALIYAIGQDSGLGFIFANASASAVSTYIGNQVDYYCAGSSLASMFALDQARLVAGKLVVGQLLYNDIKNFLSWLVTGKSDGDIILPGVINGIVIDQLNDETGEFGGYLFDGGVVTGSSVSDSYQWFDVYSGQNRISRSIAYFEPDVFTFEFVGWQLIQNDNSQFQVQSVFLRTRISTGEQAYRTYKTSPPFLMSGNIFDQGSINVSDYDDTDIDAGYQWEGSFPGLPDTNLDDLLDSIYDVVADTNLEVEGEVTPAEPMPTPVPTIAPDTPLQDVPWEDLHDLVDGLGQDITGSIDDLIDQTAEGVQDITDAIDAVVDAVSDITETLTPPDIEEKTFDLTELFPFCIPFDIYHLLQAFDATPAAPHVQLPIVIPSLGFSYTMDLDFSAWNPVAAAMRTVELIVYALGLAWATSKVIKW